MTSIQRILLGITAIMAAMVSAGLCPVHAQEKLDSIEIGQPQRIEVFPASIQFTGKRQQMQLAVTGYYADGSLQDLTRAATFASADTAIARIEGAVALPQADGNTAITVSVGQLPPLQIPVASSRQASPDPVSFEYGALAALSKNGCNAGACHGSPSGKGGFRLSLRAFDPQLDKLTLIREDFGRRTNPFQPEQSLLLTKPMMKVSHGGGLKLRKADPAFRVLRDWIAEGCKLDPDNAPRCVKIEVYPPTGRLYKRPAHTQQLVVTAHFSDGSMRDVTPLAVYTSSDTEVASVSETGLVVGRDRGEAAIIVRYMEFIESNFMTFVKDIPGFAWTQSPVQNYIDDHVNSKLKKLSYSASELCTDEELLRRVYLDVIGILPTIAESNRFLTDRSPYKRRQLIDELLQRPEYAKFWALKWGDLLKMTTAAVGGDGVHKYHRWVEKAIEENMPYDEFARHLLTAAGSTHTNPPANFYRTTNDAMESVETISQVFLGARLQCAKCHNHPFERWTQDNYYGMAAFFNRVQKKKTRRPDELVVWLAPTGEVTQPRTGKQMKPWLPLSGDLEPPVDKDRRDLFADWLTRRENPFFAKVEVNRIWSQLLGRGIVEPNDDFRESNPPANASLIEALARDFADHGFDRKHVIRTILNSRTYQASFRANDFNKDDVKYASHFQPRLLSAEQLLDAICAVTDMPEQFGTLPAGTKATQIPAPDLAKNDFLKTFGQPERQTVCACERSSESNLGMAIQFFNGPLIYEKLRNENNRFRKMLKENKTDLQILNDLYMAAVCRTPTPGEIDASLKHIAAKNDRVIAFEDICWALLNTNEFLFQH
ncbi:MAG: DUF1549 domain-containing protein [Planctomycetes bacterium]|nr:DUF1549 domain-containing protein [Planctomycetota bacterium]